MVSGNRAQAELPRYEHLFGSGERKSSPATESVFREAAETELAEARGLKENAFKIDLAKRVIVDTLVKLTSRAETVR